MTIFAGFSTQSVNKRLQINQQTVGGGVGTITQPSQLGKKFRLTDEQLVIQDLVNALSIKQGDKVGNPGYGTTLWEFLFDPNTSDVVKQLETEIRRVAGTDPRIQLDNVNAYSYENGILIEVQATIQPLNSYVEFGLLIDKQTGTIQNMTT